MMFYQLTVKTDAVKKVSKTTSINDIFTQHMPPVSQPEVEYGIGDVCDMLHIFSYFLICSKISAVCLL